MTDIDVTKLSDKQLVDLHGVLGVRKKEIETKQKAVGEELISRGVLPLIGDAFKSTRVPDSVSWVLDKQKIEQEMGEAWVIKHSKQQTRSAYVLSTALPSAAAKVVNITDVAA